MSGVVVEPRFFLVGLMPPKKKGAKSPKKKKKSEKEDGEDSDGADSGVSGKASTAGTLLALLTVMFIGVKTKTCRLCGCKSDEESPLTSTCHPDDDHSGRRPWRSYTKHSQSEKRASGRLCLICWNVFRQLGHAIFVCVCVFRLSLLVDIVLQA